MRWKIKIENPTNALDIQNEISYIITMNGTVTKKDFFAIWIAFGLTKAIAVLLSRKPTALHTLMKG